MSNKEFISPIPKVWHEIHQRLENYWKNDLDSKGGKPPTPLILAGWNFSSDFEKSERWKSTLLWAEERNCKHLIKDLGDDEKYYG
jgi:hypothetical protein